ncbi:MAG: hypothetical protein CVU32_00920 [Betaproteobacteria bacterium HGW-Betaproteobacteria-5]|nr:MAG: hypothetical protein CVU32_00920 [Betaproteobacteria bacterium HGW-Betaproteobacteria-5]
MAAKAEQRPYARGNRQKIGQSCRWGMSVPKAATDRSAVIGPIGALTDAQALAYCHQQSLQARIEQMRAGFDIC